MPQMQPIQSTAISAAGYDPDTQELTVEFTSGRSYTHPGVPPDVYEGLMSADSAGRYYAQQIKGRY